MALLRAMWEGDAMGWPETGEGGVEVTRCDRRARGGKSNEDVGWSRGCGEELRECGLHLPSESITDARVLRYLLGDDDCSAARSTEARRGDNLDECIALPSTVPQQTQDVALGMEAVAAWEHGFTTLY